MITFRNTNHLFWGIRWQSQRRSTLIYDTSLSTSPGPGMREGSCSGGGPGRRRLCLPRVHPHQWLIMGGRGGFPKTGMASVDKTRLFQATSQIEQRKKAGTADGRPGGSQGPSIRCQIGQLALGCAGKGERHGPSQSGSRSGTRQTRVAEFQVRRARSQYPACGNGDASARPETTVGCYSSRQLIRAKRAGGTFSHRTEVQCGSDG